VSSPIWGLRPDFNYFQTVAGLLMGALSLTRERVCRLQLFLVLANAVIRGSESRGTHNHILLSQIRDSRNLECQVPVFISPQAQGYPVVPPGTRSPFRRLLRLAGLRWRYRTRLVTVSQSYITTDGSVGQSVLE
jgi:hypothetical protein